MRWRTWEDHGSYLEKHPEEVGEDTTGAGACTVRKKDLILRPIERRPQMQFSIARRFKPKLLRRYSVKFSKMRNFTLGKP
jgi:hypothetical protein